MADTSLPLQPENGRIISADKSVTMGGIHPVWFLLITGHCCHLRVWPKSKITAGQLELVLALRAQLDFLPRCNFQ